MVIKCKVNEMLGEVVTTGKGSHICEYLVTTQDGKKEVVKLLVGADKKADLLALKPDSIANCRLPENFFFLNT